jgi:hypothetical protein
MIFILNHHKKISKEFKTYHELVRHIMDTENTKLITENPNLDDAQWSFLYYPHDRINERNSLDHSELNKSQFEQALIHCQGIFEICYGDCKKPHYVAKTSYLDIEELKKIWCYDYLRFHDQSILETIDVRQSIKENGREIEEILKSLSLSPDSNDIRNAHPYNLLLKLPYLPAQKSIRDFVKSWEDFISSDSIV